MMSVVRGFCDDDDDATIEFCWSFVLHRSLTMSTEKQTETRETRYVGSHSTIKTKLN